MANLIRKCNLQCLISKFSFSISLLSLLLPVSSQVFGKKKNLKGFVTLIEAHSFVLIALE